MIGWDLDYSITLQLFALVAIPADHLQGHIGLPGFHKWSDLSLHQENRLNGCYDIGVENLTDKFVLLFSQLVIFIHHDNVIFSECRDNLLLEDQVKDRLLIGDNLVNLLNYGCRVDIFEVLLREFTFVSKHLFVVADPHLVELLRIVGVDGQEFNPLIQGQGFIHGFLKYPEIKREPADIPVGVFVFAHKEEMNIQM